VNDTNRIGDSPRSVIVVGAGIIGLSTAWFLQDRGVAVTVVDRSPVAAGASWGNAGWISPGLAIPLHVPASVNPRHRRTGRLTSGQQRRTPADRGPARPRAVRRGRTQPEALREFDPMR